MFPRGSFGTTEVPEKYLQHLVLKDNATPADLLQWRKTCAQLLRTMCNGRVSYIFEHLQEPDVIGDLQREHEQVLERMVERSRKVVQAAFSSPKRQTEGGASALGIPTLDESILPDFVGAGEDAGSPARKEQHGDNDDVVSNLDFDEPSVGGRSLSKLGAGMKELYEDEVFLNTIRQKMLQEAQEVERMLFISKTSVLNAFLAGSSPCVGKGIIGSIKGKHMLHVFEGRVAAGDLVQILCWINHEVGLKGKTDMVPELAYYKYQADYHAACVWNLRSTSLAQYLESVLVAKDIFSAQCTEMGLSRSQAVITACTIGIFLTNLEKDKSLHDFYAPYVHERKAIPYGGYESMRRDLIMWLEQRGKSADYGFRSSAAPNAKDKDPSIGKPAIFSTRAAAPTQDASKKANGKDKAGYIPVCKYCLNQGHKVRECRKYEKAGRPKITNEQAEAFKEKINSLQEGIASAESSDDEAVTNESAANEPRASNMVNVAYTSDDDENSTQRAYFIRTASSVRVYARNSSGIANTIPVARNTAKVDMRSGEGVKVVPKVNQTPKDRRVVTFRGAAIKGRKYDSNADTSSLIDTVTRGDGDSIPDLIPELCSNSSDDIDNRGDGTLPKLDSEDNISNHASRSNFSNDERVVAMSKLTNYRVREVLTQTPDKLFTCREISETDLTKKAFNRIASMDEIAKVERQAGARIHHTGATVTAIYDSEVKGEEVDRDNAMFAMSKAISKSESQGATPTMGEAPITSSHALLQDAFGSDFYIDPDIMNRLSQSKNLKVFLPKATKAIHQSGRAAGNIGPVIDAMNEIAREEELAVAKKPAVTTEAEDSIDRSIVIVHSISTAPPKPESRKTDPRMGGPPTSNAQPDALGSDFHGIDPGSVDRLSIKEAMQALPESVVKASFIQELVANLREHNLPGGVRGEHILQSMSYIEVETDPNGRYGKAKAKHDGADKSILQIGRYDHVNDLLTAYQAWRVKRDPKFKFKEYKTPSNPDLMDLKTIQGEEVDVDLREHVLSFVHGALYLAQATRTIPDVTFTVMALASLVSNPPQEIVGHLDRLFGYLKSTSMRGVVSGTLDNNFMRMANVAYAIRQDDEPGG